MIEEIAERLRTGYSVFGGFARLSLLLMVGSLLQAVGSLEERGRRGRHAARN